MDGEEKMRYTAQDISGQDMNKASLAYLVPSVPELPRNLHCTIPEGKGLPFSLEHFQFHFLGFQFNI